MRHTITFEKFQKKTQRRNGFKINNKTIIHSDGATHFTKFKDDSGSLILDPISNEELECLYHAYTS